MTPDQKWEGHLWRRYGLTIKRYRKLEEEQGGVCAICSEQSIRLRLSVDHCHNTGKIRGLLCERCNTLLGRIKDNPMILLSAIIYLEDNGIKITEAISE